MSDIVEKLELVFQLRPSTPDSFEELIPVQWGVLKDAIAEITNLRAKIVLLHQIAGKASVEGMTFSDIKKEIRSGKNAEG